MTYKINKRPNTVSELRIVFVLVGYFRKSKPNFCNIASLLYDLLKHHQPDKSSIETISWEQKHYSALNTLLHTFAYPNFSKPFILHTGAPGRGLGWVCSVSISKWWVHSFGLWKPYLVGAECKYHSFKLEFLALKSTICKCYTRARSSVVSDLHSETKDFRFESSC